MSEFFGWMKKRQKMVLAIHLLSQIFCCVFLGSFGVVVSETSSSTSSPSFWLGRRGGGLSRTTFTLVPFIDSTASDRTNHNKRNKARWVQFEVPRGGDLSWGSSSSSSSDKDADAAIATEQDPATEKQDESSKSEEEEAAVENPDQNLESVDEPTEARNNSMIDDPIAGDEDEGSVTPLEEHEEDAAAEGEIVEEDPSLNHNNAEEDVAIANQKVKDDPSSESHASSSSSISPFEAVEAVVQDDPTLDENDSTAYVDRMELADDEGGETTPGGFDLETNPTEKQSSQSLSSSSSVTVNMSGGDSSLEAENVENLEITKEMKDVLIKELRYTKSEVAAMKPYHAAIAVEKRLWRPWEGMPPSWYKPGSFRANGDTNGIRNVLPKLVVPAIIGAVVVSSSLQGQVDIPDLLSSLKERFLPAATVIAASTTSRPPVVEDKGEELSESASVAESQRAVPRAQSSPPSALLDEPSDPLPVNEHVNALGEPHAHSIRPGLEPQSDDELDVTWLDKAITAFERKLQSLLGRKKK